MQILRSKLMDLKCCRRWCTFHILNKLRAFQVLSVLLINYTIFYCTSQALPSIAKEVIEILDILLRWFVLQFCKSNTTCLLKVQFSFYFIFHEICYIGSKFNVYAILIAQVLEFLPELLDILKDDGYSLTESEVAIFLPCLVEKVCITKFDRWYHQ